MPEFPGQPRRQVSRGRAAAPRADPVSGEREVPACSQLTWSQRTQPWGSIVPPSLPRDFVEQHYVTLKKANPDFPILIRECSGVQPKLWARYGKWGLLAGKHCRVCSEWWWGGVGSYSKGRWGEGAAVCEARWGLTSEKCVTAV